MVVWDIFFFFFLETTPCTVAENTSKVQLRTENMQGKYKLSEQRIVAGMADAYLYALLTSHSMKNRKKSSRNYDQSHRKDY